ncbi:hypothetical protein B0O80DRAFT_462001 [Mortierella sp. GBAus27b]|nr:Vacuolar protein sorting-associated protein 51 [Mortierella sp. GBA43]KAI8348671.1 hypothetical protein B0O80DRAFT_462001 [Mortierella sp. GBAus27b]
MAAAVGNGPTRASDAQSATPPPPTRTRAAGQTAATATSTSAAEPGPPGPPGPPGATPTTRRRAKSFLRNYYGIQQGAPATQDGPKETTTFQPGPVSKADPYDLDSHAFEVDKYMHKMFVEKQLPGLVRADNELVADIRQLDGDMKTLVYENYSKFLSATDTINKMKSNVDNLESEMSRLTQNISKIATSSSAIHSSLGTRRDKIRQLNGVHSLLTKLQFVFELPTNLHQCLETESYTQAVKSYCRTLHLLQHYRHLTVFTGIERECNAIMVQISQRIRQKMCADRATVTEISECVGLLLALKEDPVALQKQYLVLSLKYLDKVNTRTLEDIKTLPLYVPPSTATTTTETSPAQAASIRRASKRLSSRMFSASDIHDSTAEASSLKDKDKEIRRSKSLSLLISGPPPADKVSYLNQYYLRQVEGFVVSFRNYYLAVPASPQTPLESATSASNEDSNSALEQRPPPTPGWIGKDPRVYANLTKEQQDQAAADVKEAVSRIMGRYLDTVSSFLEYPDDIFGVQPEVHVHVLQSVYLATLSCHGLCQLVGFDTLVAGVIQNWETQLIRRALDSAKLQFMDRMTKQDDRLLRTKEEDEHERLLNATLGGGTTTTIAHHGSSSPATEGVAMAQILKETTGWLHDMFKKETIPFLEKCTSTDAQFLDSKEGRKLFLKNFQAGLKAFWDDVLKQMQHASLASSSSKPTPCSRTLSLIMSQLCFQLSKTTVEQVYRTLSKTLFRPGGSKRSRSASISTTVSGSGSFLIDSYEEPLVLPQLQWDCKTVIQGCQEAGHVLLDGFIARAANELSWIVMGVPFSALAMNSMTMVSPPMGVSETWEEIYRQLNDVERQVILVYGDDGHGDGTGRRGLSSESMRREPLFRAPPGGGGASGSNNNAGGSGSGGNNNDHGHGHRSRLSSFGSNTMNSRFFETQQQHNLLSNIDKLFSDRVEIFTRCQDLNRIGIMLGIIKILLKAWAEAVRTNTFTKGGFQQVQVDAEFAKGALWKFVAKSNSDSSASNSNLNPNADTDADSDTRLVHSLLDETQQTAFRRCIDPVPLDPQTVDTLIHSSDR